MRSIFYGGRLAALAEGDRVIFCRHIEVLEADHPLRRFISAVCLWSCEVDARRVAVRFDPGAAEVYARALLMPAELDRVTGPERQLEQRLLALEALQALAALRPAERRLLALRYAGYSYREIAALEGRGTNYVNKHLVRGKRRLRTREGARTERMPL